MDKKSFFIIAKNNKPKGNLFKDLGLAFVGGGLVAVLNQGLNDLLLLSNKFNKDEASMLSSIIIVFIVGILTYLGVYSKLGQIFGGGLFIPLTGFSNAMVSSSIDGKDEGLINGIGKNVFILGGVPIAYGITFSILASLIKILFF